MKMVMAVIHDEDSHRLMEALTKEGFMATKLASTGGLLKTGNTTLFVGVEKDKVDKVVELIKEICKTSKKCPLLTHQCRMCRIICWHILLKLPSVEQRFLCWMWINT